MLEDCPEAREIPYQCPEGGKASQYDLHRCLGQGADYLLLCRHAHGVDICIVETKGSPTSSGGVGHATEQIDRITELLDLKNSNYIIIGVVYIEENRGSKILKELKGALIRQNKKLIKRRPIVIHMIASNLEEVKGCCFIAATRIRESLMSGRVPELRMNCRDYLHGAA